MIGCGAHRGRAVSTGIVVGDRFSGRRSPLAMTCTHSRGHRESQPDTSIATADRHLRWEAEAGGQGCGGGSPPDSRSGMPVSWQGRQRHVA